MRKRLFEIIENARNGDVISRTYDIFMLCIIFISLVPLMCMERHTWTGIIDFVCMCIFIFDYAFRLITADYKVNRGTASFYIYPFTPFAIIDLLSILPYFTTISSALRVIRLARLVRIVRLFKVFRYSSKMMAFVNVLRKERQVLMIVLMVSLLYIFATALIMFNVEPHVNPVTGKATFTSFFDALYWATVTLTTVGYGDLCPVTEIGRFISMLSSIFGVAIIALPSGVITASYLDEIRKLGDQDDEDE